jgi:tetratricopeptide (TPR) repeat protein
LLGRWYVFLKDFADLKDNTDQCIEVYQQALKLKKDMFSPDNRELAEVYHLLGLAYENAGKIEQSIEYIQNARQVLEARVQVLQTMRGKGKGPMTPEMEADNAEVDEIEEILPDLDAKIDDLKGLRDQQAEADKVANQEKVGTMLAQNPDMPVNDLSGLVKKRKAPEVAEEPQEKRAKQE